MSTGRFMDKICVAAVILSLVLTILFMNGSALGIVAAGRNMGYENRLFDPSAVHTVDIVMDDWDAFLETCENEEYSPCAVVIDGESYKNVAIRAKGNTSLSSVRALGSRRYSFKLEFDQYETGKTYHGLDKLSLNNLIQDNTMMKDYLVYRMMDDFGADAPLCSYAYITVNGEDWGLYLAVEGVEDSFLERNYGSDSGELYKPDSMNFGGGRGNGRDFDFGDFNFNEMEFPDMPQTGGGAGAGRTAPGGQTVPNGQTAPAIPDNADSIENGETSEYFGGFDDGSGDGFGGGRGNGRDFDFGDFDGNFRGGFDGGFGGGMGSADVKLQYIDDDPDSYGNIFDNAKTDITENDKRRLVNSLKNLSSYTDLENTLDTDEVLRYFVIHNFVCNGDSYTGAMIHNYYLHEQDGRLSMIPWDYNLAFGTFQGGSADSSVNASIDNPVSDGSVDDRPMLGWIFSDESYTQEYYALFSEFIDRWFSEGQLAQMIEETRTLLRPYVESDPTKFCTADEFEAGVQALEQFVTLRAEAVSRQLAGDTSAVDTTGLAISAMGSMGDTMGGFGGRGRRNGAADTGAMPGSEQQTDSSGTTAAEGVSENNEKGIEPQSDGSGTVDNTEDDPENNGKGTGPQNRENQPVVNENEGEGAEETASGFPAVPPDAEFPGNSEETAMASVNGTAMDGENGTTVNGTNGIAMNRMDGAAIDEMDGANSVWILLGASVLLLSVGLLVAAKFKY